MKWQRVLAVLGVVGLLNVLAIVAVARPWLPDEEQIGRSHVEGFPDMIHYTHRTRRLSWSSHPDLAYDSMTHYTHTGEKTTTLTLGFLTVTLNEEWVSGFDKAKR